MSNTPATSSSDGTSIAPTSPPQTSKKRSMVTDTVRQEEEKTEDKQESDSGKKRQRIVYETKRDQGRISSINFEPIVAGMAGINLQEQRLDKGKDRAIRNIPASTLIEAMASFGIQERTFGSWKKEKHEEQQLAKKEETPSSSTSTPRAPDVPSKPDAMGYDFKWYRDVFDKETGDSFVCLFDIMQRRNDSTKTFIQRQLLLLPISSTERRAKLATALLELGLDQAWLQANKETYLSHTGEARELVRGEVLYKLTREVFDRDQARWLGQIDEALKHMDPERRELHTTRSIRPLGHGYAPPTPLDTIRWNEVYENIHEEIARRDALDGAHWRAKAETERRAAERKRIEDEVKWRVQAAEDQFTWRLKAAEDRYKRQLKDVEYRAWRRAQETENRGRPGSQVEQRTTAEPRSQRL
ncbi:MAG: hypothetical protein BYD32DRAFT_423235 [Podila humilis]|nr:MAG: hypothetical protein BYD32DRAFT_423235 [Podila humilis]